MAKNHIRVKELRSDEANRLAKQFASERSNRLVALDGAAAKPASVFKWSSWTDVPEANCAFLVLVRGEPALVMWFEPDTFNSECLHVTQARLHWILSPPETFISTDLPGLSSVLSRILHQSEVELVTLRLFGHEPAATHLFQRAGFRLVVGNAWLYRWPIKSVGSERIPKDVSLDVRNLNERPLPDDEVHGYLKVASESFFADRFSLDLNLDQVLVRQRFLSIIENGLRGDIADYAVTARSKSSLEAFAFFAVKKSVESNSYPQAGKWLTLIARSSQRAQGIAHFVIAEAIRGLPEGKANWMCTCSLDNFGSLRTAQKMGFQIGAIVYDMHRWRENPIN